MKTVRLSIELTYDDLTMHSCDEDQDAKDWFYDHVIAPSNDHLHLHCNDIGDTIGSVRVVSGNKDDKPTANSADVSDTTGGDE